MAKTPLPMRPTGWFQVAWSAEIAVGAVHRMHYFDTEMIAWRSAAGQVTVMDAYCEHLGAHLGYGGTVDGEIIRCPFHGWEWDQQGRNVCVPYESRPNRGRKIRVYPVEEHSESVFIWYDEQRRDPYFVVAAALTAFDDGKSEADYYPAYGHSTLFEKGVEIHPQYVMENGVDFAHFTYVHATLWSRSSRDTISTRPSPTSTSPSRSTTSPPTRSTAVCRRSTAGSAWPARRAGG